MIARMDLTSDGSQRSLPLARDERDRPFIQSIDALLTPAECDYLIDKARPRLQPSIVIDPHSGRQLRNPVRTSDGMAFPFVIESPVVHLLNQRVAVATGTDVRQDEPLQVLRYSGGQEYRPHMDAVAGDANPRVMTALVYLNSSYDGGETQFLGSGFQFKGKRGDVLLFRNTLADGRPDELTQHAGRSVTSGEKWLASRWIRDRPFMFPSPTPVLDA